MRPAPPLPLLQLLPLLLALDTAPANTVPSSHPFTSESPRQLRAHGTPGTLLPFRQGEAGATSTQQPPTAAKPPGGDTHPRPANTPFKTLSMPPRNLETYQLSTHTVSVSDSKLKASDSNEIFRRVRSDNNELVLNNNIQSLSHVLESSANVSRPSIDAESLVLSRNDTRISSLGSVDLIVPSLEGMNEGPSRTGDPSSGLNSSVVQQGSGSNRSKSSIQRQGRTDAPMLNYIFDTYSTLNKHHHRNDRFGGPKIESAGGELSVDTDANAGLDCRVSSLQDKLVSWVRRRPEDDKLELLTIGQQTYSADNRFVVDFRQPDNWRLVLKGARSLDSGTYECQVSTHPPLISRIQLSVNAPTVRIVEAGGRELRDKYYERNSTLRLACRVRHLAAHAHVVTWLHAGRALNDDTQRGGVSVKTESVDGGADSTLLVARLNASDSGRYTCSVGVDLHAVVNVHVLNESLAELHQGAAPPLLCSPHPFLLIIIVITLHQLVDQIALKAVHRRSEAAAVPS